MPSGTPIPSASDFRPVDFKNMTDRLFNTHVRNIENTYEATDDKTKEAGRIWYPEARNDAFGVGRGDAERGAGVLAALSPGQPWPVNHLQGQELAEHPLRGQDAADLSLADHRQHQAFQAVRAAERVLGKKNAPPDLYTAHMQATADHRGLRGALFSKDAGRGHLINQSSGQILKAHAIQHGAAPDDVLDSRMKTGNFYHNIADPSDPHYVTVDTHAHDVAVGRQMPWKTERGMDAYGRYGHFADAFRAATRRSPERTANAMQAITWLGWKGAHAA